MKSEGNGHTFHCHQEGDTQVQIKVTHTFFKTNHQHLQAHRTCQEWHMLPTYSLGTNSFMVSQTGMYNHPLSPDLSWCPKLECTIIHCHQASDLSWCPKLECTTTHLLQNTHLAPIGKKPYWSSCYSAETYNHLYHSFQRL